MQLSPLINFIFVINLNILRFNMLSYITVNIPRTGSTAERADADALKGVELHPELSGVTIF